MMGSVLSILGALDDLFDLLFLAGISYIVFVLWHHHISLIGCLCLLPSAVLSHARQSPAVPSHYYFYMRAAVIPNTCRLNPPPRAVLTYTLQSLPTPCRLPIPPIVPRESCSPVIPPTVRPSSHFSICMKTNKGLACRARRFQPRLAVPRVICPTQDFS